MGRTIELTMAGGTGADFYELIEWLRSRGFRVQESHHADVAKLTAERAAPRVLRGRPANTYRAYGLEPIVSDGP